MQYIEHPLDKYIANTRATLMSIPEGDSTVLDTTILQVMCLEKFANAMGIRLEGGLFVTSLPGERVITLDRMAALYNETLQNALAAGHSFSGLLIEQVFLRGRSLRRRIAIQKHQVKFV